MTKAIIYILLFITPVLGSSQDGQKNSWAKSYPENGLYEQPDTRSWYVGGNSELHKFFEANLSFPYQRYPNDNHESVSVKFIVEPDSTVSNIEVLKSNHPAFTEEVVRVVKLLKFVPAKDNGQVVRSLFMLRVGLNFKKIQASGREINENGPKVFEMVDKMPKYPGGKDSMDAFIKKNVMYPDSLHKGLFFNKIYIKCFVETDSSTSNIIIQSTTDETLNEEAVRLVKLMKFTPGMEMEVPVRVLVSFPIEIPLPDDKKYAPFGWDIGIPEQTYEEECFEIVEKMPEYPGGDGKRQEFIEKNLLYPETVKKEKKQGTIIVQFVIEKDGSISDVKAVKKFDEECAEEAIRVVKMMKWKPGEQRGKKVRVKMLLPIKFKIKDDK